MRTWNDIRYDIEANVDPAGLLTGDEDAEELDAEFRRIWGEYNTSVEDLERYLAEIRDRRSDMSRKRFSGK